MIILALLCFLLVSVCPIFSVAESNDDDVSDRQDPSGAGFRLRGQRLPVCKSFLIVEVGYSLQLYSTPGEDQYGYEVESSYGTFELGYMRNRDENSALGGTLFIGLKDSGNRIGPVVRYRKWLSDKRSISYSAGLVMCNQDEGKSFGFTGSVAYNIMDLIALSTRIEFTPGNKADQFSVYIGANIGSYATIGAAILAIPLALIGSAIGGSMS
jgi:hypothetical protein